MATYKTPGVFVEEISTIPPSVAEVETAIPAFIGFTERGEKNVPKKIFSMLEYQLYFGGAQVEENITAAISPSDEITVSIASPSKNVMFYAMQLYFANGGGPCYIVSTGLFADNNAVGRDAYEPALAEIAKEDEPTLLVFPDAPFSLGADQYYALMNDAIAQCTRLGDRFAIVDVVVADQVDVQKSIDAFRQGIAGSENVNLKYAAAYFPYLNTLINYNYDEEKVEAAASAEAAQIQTNIQSLTADVDSKTQTLTTAKADLTTDKEDKAKQKAVTKAEQELATVNTALTNAKKQFSDAKGAVLNSLVINRVKQKINELGVVLSPCAAIAGVYASVDNARGVWKAPANVSLNYVKSAVVKITDDDQDNMNIDVTDGKSVNAIRSFIGKGIKVWGARTLDGNDNEWKFINVRRFFNMVEESVKKSTYWAVFEANDSNTWVKVRGMIENYLNLKWRDGALAGAKPDDAYFVRVGLGQTMTAQDVLEGRMIIEIGMAAVRPAEFIILKFSHKIQNS